MHIGERDAPAPRAVDVFRRAVDRVDQPNVAAWLPTILLADHCIAEAGSDAVADQAFDGAVGLRAEIDRALGLERAEATLHSRGELARLDGQRHREVMPLLDGIAHAGPTVMRTAAR